ncbi:MMPL family transporter [Mycobacterium sp. 21AC1]|uniref:MMPL family transporter n=1 Tax=[Mycobacterium] appelbergii TaxID=2939269 RepID=UPI0029392A98|nr:MMPL family transporter [Mycobacterium sp. 21AC1]MDV3128511.1 MMPL family transporter [Mycobacterium sp. 21AC1]
MFAWWGRTVYRLRYIVIGVMVALCLGGGVYGISLGDHVTQSGFYDEGSQSVQASLTGDEVYGRDRTSHVVAILTPPDDKKVTDKAWQKDVTGELDQLVDDHKDNIVGWVGWLKAPDTTDPTVSQMKTQDLRHTFISVPLQGDDDDEILKNYQAIEPDLQQVNGGDIQLAGLNPLASELTGTIGTDQKRAEIAIVPLVAVVLFFVFGGAVAAALPAIIGGLTIAGALGILRLTAEFGPVHFFAQPVVTMMGFGIAIDYGLFIVSRFREELAEGYDTETAVRRSVMTSGRTVAFSAVIIVASSLPLLLIPLGFLKSITYAIIASVMLAAFLSITVLPATLGILGAHVDALGVRTLLKVPFLANWPFSRRIIDWFAEKTQKTKTREEVEKGFWGRLVNVVMKRPIAFATPILVGMTLLVLPIGSLALAGISEKYLPPDNAVRQSQEQFDKLFPGFRTEQITLVMERDDGEPITDSQIADMRAKAMTVPGFTDPDNDPDAMWKERPANDSGSKDPSVRVIQNGLENRGDAAQNIDGLRALQPPRGITVLVGGTPALEQDSIHSLFDRLPLMVTILVITTTVLMFLAFGSIVLPIKAALMSALTLGSTMGILTWMFVDGHGSGWLNYTPQPLMAPMIGLIIAVIWGLSTDYEVFLVSRMVEARERGMSTAEAIRIGTATTGRLITGAALVLAVVAGAFAFSDLVMMKYLAFGLLIALLLDATVIRMFLVPAIMKLLGDDCWWAPLWMKRIQEKLGLGETELPDERKRPTVREPADDERALVGAAMPPPPRPRPHDPTHPGVDQVRPVLPPRTNAPSAAGTTRLPSPPPQQQPPQQQAEEPPTTRFAMAKNAVRNAVNNAVGNATGNANANTPTQRTPAPPTGQPVPPPPGGPPGPAAQREEREIESWLGALRGGPAGPAGPPPPQPPPPPPPRPSADSTRAMPQSRPAPGDNAPTTAFSAQRHPDAPQANGGAADPTTAIPVPRKRDQDPSTEQLNTRDKDEPKRRGGGMSAQDLLRREGRL